jgi:hypothetical protein
VGWRLVRVQPVGSRLAQACFRRLARVQRSMQVPESSMSAFVGVPSATFFGVVVGTGHGGDAPADPLP